MVGSLWLTEVVLFCVCHFQKDQGDFYARFDEMNHYFSTKGGVGGITSYYILLHIYFSSEDEGLFSRFKSEMDRLKVMNFLFVLI